MRPFQFETGFAHVRFDGDLIPRFLNEIKTEWQISDIRAEILDEVLNKKSTWYGEERKFPFADFHDSLSLDDGLRTKLTKGRNWQCLDLFQVLAHLYFCSYLTKVNLFLFKESIMCVLLPGSFCNIILKVRTLPRVYEGSRIFLPQ